MYNDDLKRFYQVNSTPEMLKDFARYTKNGTLQSAEPKADNDLVTLKTLREWSDVSDFNYKGVWTSGDEIYTGDLVYLDTDDSRIFYVAVNDIAESTVSPNEDTDNWKEFLEVANATIDTSALVTINTEQDITATKNFTSTPTVNGTSIATADSLSNYMTKADPRGTGSLSINRKANTGVGGYSVAVGRNTAASGIYSYAEGNGTTASGYGSHAEGGYTTASGQYSHAEGYDVVAGGSYSHAEGYDVVAEGIYSHAEGANTTASGQYSHAEGIYTTANSKSQHVFGEYNALDTNTDTTARGTYVEIVGNGTNSARSNARTLDWDGNQWIAGKYYYGENNTEVGTGSIQSTVYDDTTLADHITEILGHTNIENGGTLLKVGFKIGSASVAANGTKTTISNGTSPTVETSSVSVFGASRFYSFTASDIMTESGTTTLTLAGPNGLSGASQSVIEITSTSDNATQTCSVSGSTTIVNGTNIEITAFSGIDLLSIPLEHLIIDYYTT